MNKKVRVIDIIVIIALMLVFVLIIVNINKKKDNENNAKQTENSVQVENKVEEKYVQILSDGTKLNDSTKLNNNKKVNDWELSNVQLIYKDGITNLLCDVKNISKSVSPIQEVKVVLRDEKGNEIYSFNGVVEEIQPGETKQFNASITADFANAYDFTLVKK